MRGRVAREAECNENSCITHALVLVFIYGRTHLHSELICIFSKHRKPARKYLSFAGFAVIHQIACAHFL